MISSNTKLIGLFGYPVRHSLSPFIQNYFIRKYQKDAVYLTFEIGKNDLKSAYIGAKKLGFIGLNVTMPYKEKLCKLVDLLKDPSDKINSVNTIKFLKNDLIAEGYNSDVGGFLKSLKDKNFSFKGKNCLIIGAGGASKSSVYSLIKEKVNCIYIFNRTLKKAEKIKNELEMSGNTRILIMRGIKELRDSFKSIDLIVNCTPIGMNINSFRNMMPIPSDLFLKDKYIFEMVYNPIETIFLKKAKKDGAVIVDGLDMLINQAAFSFGIWFDIIPETNNVRIYLKEIYKNNFS